VPHQPGLFYFLPKIPCFAAIGLLYYSYYIKYRNIEMIIFKILGITIVLILAVIVVIVFVVITEKDKQIINLQEAIQYQQELAEQYKRAMLIHALPENLQIQISMTDGSTVYARLPDSGTVYQQTAVIRPAIKKQ
jgi:hypothetical protein